MRTLREIVMSHTGIKTRVAICNSRHRRGSLAVALLVVSMVLVGCGSDDPGGTAGAPVERARASAPSEASPTAQVPAESQLEGTWQSGLTSLTETEATVRRHGLGRWVKAYRRNAPFTRDTVLTLTIERGSWDLYGAFGAGQPEPIDYDAEYVIDGDTVVFHHSEGSNTYRWAVSDDDVLRLRFIRSTLPGYRGIPEEVFQRALYMTSTFSRQS